MAVPSDIRDQAYKLFIQEVPDLLNSIESDLLTLRQERNLTKIHNLMRNSHSIKGGAASVGLDEIATLAHRLENIFKALYSESLEISTDLESQLLQVYDCLRLPLMQQVTTGQFDAAQVHSTAEPIFAQVEKALGDILIQIEHYDIPTSAQLGVDMSLSILDVDVSEQLERLSMAIATASVEKVEQELHSQIEVFVELAEILNKPGLGAIAETVQDAINTQPLEQIIPIAEAALKNFQTYQKTLLESGGKHEIAPSEELLSFVGQAEDHDGFIWETAELEPNSWNDLSDSIIIDGELVGDISADLERETAEELTSPISELVSPQESFQFSFSDLLDTLEEIQPAISLDTTSLDTTSLDTTSLDTTDVLNPIDVLDLADVELTPQLTVQPIRPASTDVPPFTPFTPPTQPISAQIPHHEIPVAPNVTTRVNSEKLERMNNLVNEAVIQRSSLSLENEQIQKSVRELLNRFSAIERIVVQLRKVSDRTLISPPHTTGTGLEGSIGGTQSANPDFDALEMDSYGTLHSLLQQFLEDMIQLRETADDIDLFTKRSDKNLAALRKSLNYLQDDFMWVRMLPIGEVLNRFPRMLRDLSITYQKPVKLQLSGTEVLVDRAVAERIHDPLLHLLRNAFDHGIEAAHLRLQRGKPEEGLIQIKAFHRGGQTVIEVSDDGEGLNLKRIGQRALELGIISPQELAEISDDRLFNLIFESGFSTAPHVSELSGRGVGLDVVRTQLSQLKGTIAITSQPGVGTTFTLRLPLTLTSDKLLICLAGFTAIAFPSDSIEEICVPRADQVIKVGEQWFLNWRKEILPIYRVTEIVDYAGSAPELPPLSALVNTSVNTSINTSTSSELQVATSTPTNPLVIVPWRQKFVALEIDQLVTEQKLVIKPFGTMITPPSCIYGCTILGDGSVVPVVDGATLLNEALERRVRRQERHPIPLLSSANSSRGHAITPISQPPVEAISRKLVSPQKILVVDDAVALRQTLTLTLSNAGYRVLQAGDGWEAIRQIQLNPDIMLVVSDIEMPNMNGFDFMNYRRQNPVLEKIPLVILTSRSNDKHRRLAMHLGAIAYFTKPYIEQNLLQAIAEILEKEMAS